MLFFDILVFWIFLPKQNFCFLIIKFFLKVNSPRKIKSLTDTLKEYKSIGYQYIDLFKRNKGINYQLKRYKDIDYWFKRHKHINCQYIHQFKKIKILTISSKDIKT